MLKSPGKYLIALGFWSNLRGSEVFHLPPPLLKSGCGFFEFQRDLGSEEPTNAQT